MISQEPTLQLHAQQIRVRTHAKPNYMKPERKASCHRRGVMNGEQITASVMQWTLGAVSVYVLMSVLSTQYKTHLGMNVISQLEFASGNCHESVSNMQ